MGLAGQMDTLTPINMLYSVFYTLSGEKTCSVLFKGAVQRWNIQHLKDTHLF